MRQNSCCSIVLVYYWSSVAACAGLVRFTCVHYRDAMFTLSLYVNGAFNCRLSACCQYRMSVQRPIAGFFSLISITGAIPCTGYDTNNLIFTALHVTPYAAP